MKLSPERTELLRKNRNKIALYVYGSNSLNMFDLVRFYPNGSMCAGMACLTDKEQEIAHKHNKESVRTLVRKSHNSNGIHEVTEACNISKNDLKIMRLLEELHDESISSPTNDSFDKLVDKLLS